MQHEHTDVSELSVISPKANTSSNLKYAEVQYFTVLLSQAFEIFANFSRVM